LLIKNSSSIHSRPYIISAYGTNNKYKGTDVVRKWIYMYNECKKRNIVVVGFASDCEARYLKAMQISLGFFTSTPTQVHQSDIGSGRILQDPIIRQNPIGFLVTDSDNILSGKCQILQILRAIVLAILEKALFDPSDQTIGSNIQSDGIRLRRLPIGFRHQESNRILSDYRIPYDPTSVPIGSNIGTDRIRHRIHRPGYMGT
jgi:hypothetical protein